MNIQELEKIMIEHGVIIRAITPFHISIYEVRHKDKYSNAEEYYDKQLKRNMIRVKTEHSNKVARKFIIETMADTSSTVKFYKPIFYNSIEDAIQSLLK